jgi:two-component system, NarL family, sensor kinase
VRTRGDTTARVVVGLVLVGVIALAVVAVAGVAVVRRLAADQAVEEARQVTQLDARLVQRRIDDGIVTGDARSLAAVAAVIYEAVLRDPVVRVKIWSQRGLILYSDESRLIGLTEPLGADEQQVIRDGGTVAAVSDLTADENRYEREFGELTEVYTRIETPDGTPLLFESYQRSSHIADASRDIARTFTPVLIATIAGAAAVEIILTLMLIRRIRRTQRQRVRLMQHAVDASDRERRRIAADLHDGPVQEMAGLALHLSARGESYPDQPTGRVFQEAAGAVRESVRALRTAIMGIYPPDIEHAGLLAALGDLVDRLTERGIDTRLDLPAELDLDAATEALLYRACQEAVRNIEKHADASNARVALREDRGAVILTVADDGRGMVEGVGAVTDDAAHFGLSVLSDMVKDSGGSLTVWSNEFGGTTVEVRVPAQ